MKLFEIQTYEARTNTKTHKTTFSERTTMFRYLDGDKARKRFEIMTYAIANCTENKNKKSYTSEGKDAFCIQETKTVENWYVLRIYDIDE